MRLVGDLDRAWVGVVQPAQRGDAELGQPVAAEGVQDQALALPQVGVGSAAADVGQPAQAGGGEVVGVAGAGFGGGGGVEQGVAVLGDEGEQQPVDQAQQGAVVVAVGQLPVAQGGDQPAVVGVAQEPGAQGADGGFDAVAQLVQGAGAGGDGFGAPVLHPAVGGGAVGAGALLQPGAVGDLEQQEELGVQLAAEDGVEVELDVRRSGQ